ncbi:MAG TPA: DNA polymerase III subunit epsilon [Bacteroidetes bacterium]|jgi:DNA polymerase III subunit epsilon|nr:DNA polymerase III subunit epsilon [Bacteroidota bacterium]
MKLHLTRPLIFFDIETTGTDIVSDRIVQLAALKVLPDMSEEIETRLVNPQRPIPASSTSIHGITDADVAGAPAFAGIAAVLLQFFSGCDIAGFNSNRFDIPLLVEEFARCGILFPEQDCKLIDVQTIFHKNEERTLSAAYKFYCGNTLTDAHNAEADVRATLEVFKGQLERYNDLGTTVAEVHEFCNPEAVVDFARYLSKDKKGNVVYNFGKYKGNPVAQELDYARWMLRGEFPAATKLILRRLIGEAGT